jgi:hypothetical protein
LHYKGVDIEATAGNFANYEKFDRLLPIAELISTNLLDISDFRDKQIQVNAREFLKGAQLASNLFLRSDTCQFCLVCLVIARLIQLVLF